MQLNTCKCVVSHKLRYWIQLLIHSGFWLSEKISNWSLTVFSIVGSKYFFEKVTLCFLKKNIECIWIHDIGWYMKSFWLLFFWRFVMPNQEYYLMLKSFYCFSKINSSVWISEYMHVSSLIRLFKYKFDVLKTNIKSLAPNINWKLVKKLTVSSNVNSIIIC